MLSFGLSLHDFRRCTFAQLDAYRDHYEKQSYNEKVIPAMHFVAFNNANYKTKITLNKVLGKSPFETAEETDKKKLASETKAFFLSIFPMSKKDKVRNNLDKGQSSE